MTWHAVSVDKNVTRTKLTSLSRSFRALDVGGGLAEIARSSYSPGARGEKRGNTADWIRGVPAPRIIRTIPATDLTDADAPFSEYSSETSLSKMRYLFGRNDNCRDI